MSSQTNPTATISRNAVPVAVNSYTLRIGDMMIHHHKGSITRMFWADDAIEAVTSAWCLCDYMVTLGFFARTKPAPRCYGHVDYSIRRDVLARANNA